jgi:hypothetical protein
VIRVPFSGQYSKLRRRCSCAFKRSCAEPSARGRERGVSINCDESSCRQQHHSAVCTNPFQVSLACVCVCVCGCVLDSQTARRRWPGDDLGSGVICPGHALVALRLGVEEAHTPASCRELRFFTPAKAVHRRCTGSTTTTHRPSTH